MTPRTIVAFQGGVSCRGEPQGTPGFTLSGKTRDRPEEMASVVFTAAAPAGLPEALEDVLVQQTDARTYRIVCGAREWMVSAPAVHLHREVAPAFYRVIRPRPPSWGRRVFWTIVLALVRNPVSKRLLFALRRS